MARVLCGPIPYMKPVTVVRHFVVHPERIRARWQISDLEELHLPVTLQGVQKKNLMVAL